MSRSTSTFPPLRLAAALIAGLFFLVACDMEPIAPEAEAALEATAEAQGAALNMANSMALFPTWQQNFQHDIEGWEYQGAGWCGSMERVEARRGGSAGSAISPSVGSAFARIAHSDCSDGWEVIFPDGSGPASSVMPEGESFPDAGYVMDLDIYLDPDWDDGTAFEYSASFRVLDQDSPAHFRYYMHDVAAADGVLTIDGHSVSEAGWYTFRHRFAADDDGMLAVHFEVRKGGQQVFSEELPMVVDFAVGAVPTNSFPVSNVGNAYLWFPSLTAGLELAIDRQMMRLGR